MSRKRVWFSSMDDIIRANTDKTDAELVGLLGGAVTESAVRKRRQFLGIRHKRGRRVQKAQEDASNDAVESGNITL